MKVAVVFFGGNDRGSLMEVAKGLQRGIEEQGHSADLIDGEKDVNVKLTMYEFIAVGANAVNVLGGKIPGNVRHFLSNSGIITGKRTYAFVVKGGIRKLKTLKTLMGVMEHEGMYITNFHLLHDSRGAQQAGTELKLAHAHQ
jgi:menaquinone-dependent protoporphyrinogen IX oxidase